MTEEIINQCEMPHISSEEWGIFLYLWEKNGGKIENLPNPYSYEHSYDGVKSLLRDLNCDNLTARELLLPRRRKAAQELGIKHLLPPKSAFLSLATLALIHKSLRRASGGHPVTVKHAYRPKAYNEAVGGAPGSDHLAANGKSLAFDMEFKDPAAKEKAKRWLIENLYNKRYNVSYGDGHKMLHVGVHSEKGRRTWKY